MITWNRIGRRGARVDDDVPQGYLWRRGSPSPCLAAPAQSTRPRASSGFFSGEKWCVYRLERDRLRRVIGGWLAQLDPPTSEQTWPPSGPRSVTKGATS